MKLRPAAPWAALLALLLAPSCREQPPEPAPLPAAPAARPAAPQAAPQAEGARWWDPDAPQPVRAPEPARKPLTKGGKPILVAPGTGELWLAEPADYLDRLGQGYQPATRADIDAHNQRERARQK